MYSNFSKYVLKFTKKIFSLCLKRLLVKIDQLCFHSDILRTLNVANINWNERTSYYRQTMLMGSCTKESDIKV